MTTIFCELAHPVKPSYDWLNLEKAQQDIEFEKAAAPIRCKHCRHTVTALQHLKFINGALEHSFRNPGGFEFTVQCFDEADGCYVSGAATTAFTWFKGYAWQFAYCKRCHQHLGWYYSRDTDGFFGLIMPRIALE